VRGLRSLALIYSFKPPLSSRAPIFNLKTAVGDAGKPQDIDAERFEVIEGFIDW
jgi:hypothetical protein